MTQKKSPFLRRVSPVWLGKSKATRLLRSALCLLLGLFAVQTIDLHVDFLAARSARAAGKNATEGALRYRFESGATYVYDVKVEADFGDFVEEMKGKPRYIVESASRDVILLRFLGALSVMRRTKPQEGGRFGSRFPSISIPAFRPAFSQFTGIMPGGLPSRLQINSRGEVIRMRGTSQLPYLLGNLSQLMLERLPETPRKKWTVQTSIVIAKSESRFPRFLHNEDVEQTTATERVTYRITEQSDAKVTLAKTYSLTSSETVDGKPRFQVTGSGQVIFDLKRGLPASSQMKRRVIVRESDKEIDVPITISYRLLSEAEVKELEARAKALAAERAKPPTGAEREQILADLKSGNQPKILQRLLELQNKKPAKPDEEIAAALAALLTDSQASIRFPAAKALENWATEQTVPALLKVVDDDDSLLRHSAINALARLKADKAAEVIAKRLLDPADRFVASEALKKIGPDAEMAVLKYATHGDPQVRLEVCRILEAIGTSKSTQVLKQLQSDRNRLVSMAAETALRKIDSRQRSGKKVTK